MTVAKRQNVKDQSAALERIFRELPIGASAENAIPYRETIPSIVRELLVMNPRDSRRKTSDSGYSSARKALDALARSANRTVRILDGLADPAVAALNYQPAALSGLKTQLRILATVAEKATTPSPQRQAPQKEQARKIARIVAIHYERLTGDAPTAPTDVCESPYAETLRKVYKVRGVAAKAESQAREVIKERNI
jgi:hypothetical protein